MSGLQQATRRLLRQSMTNKFGAQFTPFGSVAQLHQQGPSRSAVVHEQALPQSQTPSVEAPSFLSRTQQQQPSPKEKSRNLDKIISQIPPQSRPHLAIPPAIRQHHFVGGSLTGQGKLALAPYMWTSSQKSKSESTSNGNSKTSSVVSVFHIGRDLCGHPGFVHGGLLSVLFDEVFARCVSAAFPSGLGMTANLNVDFRKPALPDRLYVLQVETTKVEGRKAWVQGRMTYLPVHLPVPCDSVEPIVSDSALLREDAEGSVMVAEAKALFIEPKFADSMVSVYRT
ncbi:hypothetical protein N7481_005970 [Penicillium waksmanii]|uniref:uncharacterized protein n=1 Tax=Penicillium waksmanii TaxID=69791 RepID=UPI0025498E2B|nr:uncharacterized protein N7481_005970 [Penicillium waksmanii]KAJ5983871.1 hypothetical protein N7481_005970 [Penicillium waksmanii]